MNYSVPRLTLGQYSAGVLHKRTNEIPGIICSLGIHYLSTKVPPAVAIAPRSCETALMSTSKLQLNVDIPVWVTDGEPTRYCVFRHSSTGQSCFPDFIQRYSQQR